MTETSVLTNLVEQLVASGPLAIGLGLVAYKLWQKVEAKDDEIRELNREQVQMLRDLRDAIRDGGNDAPPHH